MSEMDLGPLAAALAKAQTAFPAVTRDKTVTVQTKSGGSYTFSYAPLESILSAVRAPLAENGFALVQMLDEDSLVTRLIHESGAYLSGRIDLPQTSDIQAMGSAITYLRRYAVQAMLGIAAEDDDDGNRAAGNTARPAQRRERQAEAAAPQQQERPSDGSLIGVVAVADKWLEDLQVRQTPQGPVTGFRLKSGRQSLKVEARGAVALALGGLAPDVVGQTVTCWGQMVPHSFRPDGSTREVEYQVLQLERIHGAAFDIPAPHDEAGLGAAGVLCDARSDPALGDVEDCALPAGHAFPDGRPSPHEGASGSKWPNRAKGVQS